VFACEEEKFTGIKHDKSFPSKTIDYIFKRYKISKKDIETVCYYEDPQLKLKRVLKNIKPQLFKSPIYSIKSYFNIKNNIKDLNKKLSLVSNNTHYSTHHESHIYYSFYSSKFENAVCLSVDGVGELETLSIGIADSTGINYVPHTNYPHSLGLFYSAMTSFLGFKPNEGEYKMMGLASYGDPNKYIEKVRKLIIYKNSKLECNLDYFTWNTSNKIMFNDNLIDLLNMLPRLSEEIIEQCHMDLAAAVQKKYEEILFDILNSLQIITDKTNLCLSGGCAYNGTANGKIIENTQFKHIWVPPAPSDAGSAIGSCVHYMVKNKNFKGKINRNPYIGPQYGYNDIQSAIKNTRHIKFKSEDTIKRYIAKKINEGKVVGWFQGHCEFGSRALGNRSILANPTLDGMKDKINQVIKKREGFRPFAPMVIKEKQNNYFEMVDDIPYMNQVVKVKEEYIDILKAVTHVDGSARVQTVYKNTEMGRLLLEFEKISGYPILLNTSFNIKDKTMVLTPKNAVETFFDTEIDILVIENYIIFK
jgi:carbamoyltransferase